MVRSISALFSQADSGLMWQHFSFHVRTTVPGIPMVHHTTETYGDLSLVIRTIVGPDIAVIIQTLQCVQITALKTGLSS